MTKHITPTALPLLQALGLFFPDCSRTTLRQWIENQRIVVDGTVATHAQMIVAEGQEIEVRTRTYFVDQRENSLPIPIIYADNHIIVVDKPAGLLTVSTAFETQNTLFARLKQKYYPRQVYVVHRLDQDTSGVILFALSPSACEGLKATFAAHDIERQYIAIVEGRVTSPHGTWQCYLYEDKQYVVKPTDNPAKGELAITHYTTTAAGASFSRLTLTLETGKKNQIRVHCQMAGHPVLGDRKYGAQGSPIKRLALHAHKLAFTHPITKKPMLFTSPLPAAMAKFRIGHKIQPPIQSPHRH
jgi:tRNA pseudouridine32 synthase/23S rRNA pseudouridine746 synthase/23S rRNA pseudouridine1911/1915/1917 synthase